MKTTIEALRKAIYPSYEKMGQELAAPKLDGKSRKYIFWHSTSRPSEKPDLARAILQTPAEQRGAVIALARKFDRHTEAYKKNWGPKISIAANTVAFIRSITPASPRVREIFVPLLVENESGLIFFTARARSEFEQVFRSRSDVRIIDCLMFARRYRDMCLPRGWQSQPGGPQPHPDCTEGAVLRAFLELAKLPPETNLGRHVDQTFTFLEQVVQDPLRKYFSVAARSLDPQKTRQLGATVDPLGRWPEGPVALQPAEAPQAAELHDLLRDGQNVHRAERLRRTEEGQAALARAIGFDPQNCDHIDSSIKDVTSYLEAVLQQGPATTPAWLWRPRAGRPNELANALHALQGARTGVDHTDPIATNRPMQQLLALVWQAIEVFPRQPHREPNSHTAQATMRQGLIRALADCMERPRGGVAHRVCNTGISQRLLSVLQGYYPQVALDSFVSPQDLVSTLAGNFAAEHGNSVTQPTLDEFKQRSIELAATYFPRD